MDPTPTSACELTDESETGLKERLTGELRAAGCVFAEDEAEMVLDNLRARESSLPATDGATLIRDYVERRRRGEPAEYILGSARFADLRVAVGPGVFIPRRWSEGLVLRAGALLEGLSSGIAVDLGMGSGALALAVHAGSPGLTMWATEIDPVAATWASLNCAGMPGLNVVTGDLYAALPPALEHQVDLIFGSLPYVPSRELEELPRDHLVSEPLVAFDGGVEGLTPFARAMAEADRWLKPNGHVLLEIGVGQAPGATRIAHQAGFRRTAVRRDPDGGELFLEASRGRALGLSR
jgi:release factor glutamine methyltransferase